MSINSEEDYRAVQSIMSSVVSVLYSYSSTHMDTGSPKALVNMVDSLDRANFEPMFLAPSEGPLCDEFRKRGLTVLSGRSESVNLGRPLESVRRVFALRRLLANHRIDVVHINEFGWNTDLAFAARLAGCSLVLHFHNPGSVPVQNLNRLLASHVVFVSEQQKQTIEGFDRIRDKSTVLHNAIDVQAYAQGKSIRSSLGLPDDAVVVGTIAQIGKRKGIDFLIDTARRVLEKESRAVFVVIGPDHVGEEAFANSSRDAVRHDPLRGRVLFLGSRKDVPDLLASMDVFFLPTRAEPFGLVVAEAMAAGLPVVASRVGGIPEIIRSDDEGLLVEVGNCSDYAARLLHLVRDKTERMRVGETGRASLCGRFDLAALGSRLASLYGGTTWPKV